MSIERLHNPPETPEDREQILVAIREQAEELYKKEGPIVTCPCGAKRQVQRTFQCYHCGIYWCKRCAPKHFGPQPTIIEEKSE